MTRTQRGFSIVTAIFLVVVLAALAAFSVTLSRVQQTTIAFDEFGTRARQAALAGLDWGRYQIFQAGGACAAATNLVMPAATTLAPFVTTVNCSSTSHVEGGGNVVIYTLVATACNQAVGGACPNPAPTADYVERQLQETLE